MIIGVGSVVTLGLGLKEWQDVQISKANQGKSLARHVEAYLNALKHLKPFKGSDSSDQSWWNGKNPETLRC